MPNGIALACLSGAFILLISLSIIDLRTRLLPNKLVGPFALLGIIFHLTTMNMWLSFSAMALGASLCFIALFSIRAIANHFYKTDTLGLGDVKLMAAAGLWLGPETAMLALSVGAFAGLLHGVVVALFIAAKTGSKPQFSGLQIPAGPGFAVGIVIAGYILLQDFLPF